MRAVNFDILITSCYLLPLVIGDVMLDMKYIEVCNNTSPVSMEMLNQVLISKQMTGRESSDFKCFLHCLFTKYLWMDDAGGFLLHEIKRVLDETQLDTISVEYIMYVCTSMRSVDKCERAYVFVKCFWKKTYQGKVTATNPCRCNFVLDDHFVVHLPHLAFKRDSPRLPQVGEHVNVRDHYHCAEERPEHVFVCSKSSIRYGRSSNFSHYDCTLLHVMEKHNLRIGDLRNVNYTLIEECLVRVTKSSAENVIVSILDAIGNLFRSETDKRFSIGTISDCRFVDDTNNRYRRFPYWTFGVHGKTTTSDILIVYFSVSRRFGLPFVKDAKHRMPCCVVTNGNERLSALQDRIILIKDYMVFTEVINQVGVTPLEYLLFKFQDAIVLNTQSDILSESKLFATGPLKFCNERPKSLDFKYSFKFILLKKSNVIWSSRNSPECWLKVLILDDDRNRTEFLALNSHHTDIAYFLDIGSTYKLLHNEKLSPYFHKEIQRLENRPCHMLMDKSAVFVKDLTIFGTYDNEEDLIMSVEEAQDAIKRRSTKLISFQGIVCSKKFAKPIESRTAVDSVAVGFGTPGRKTHIVCFASDNETKLFMYLNNWECSQLPLGVIPGMRLLVRNVVAQKGNYLKSTVLTTLTIIAYEPKFQFRSMNLYEELYGLGGTDTLHSVRFIPNRVMISIRISRITIHSIKIVCKCKTCWNITPCNCSASRHFQVAVTFLAADHSGQALIKTTRLSILMAILGLSEHQRDKFLNAIEILGSFDNRGAPNSKDKLILNEIVHRTILVAMSVSMKTLELHCLKDEQKLNEPNEPSVLICLSARLPRND